VARIAVSAIAAIAVAAGTVVSAGAATKEVKSTVKITDGGPNGAEGKVTSKKADCEADRKVLLYQLTGSGGAKGQGEIVNRDRTDSKGSWSIDTSLTAGIYEAWSSGPRSRTGTRSSASAQRL
jgi:hypothetical protein